MHLVQEIMFLDWRKRRQSSKPCLAYSARISGDGGRRMPSILAMLSLVSSMLVLEKLMDSWVVPGSW